MSLSQNDINAFRQFCKQLSPLLRSEQQILLMRVENALGGGSLPLPQRPRKVKPRPLTHEERTRKYLQFNK